MNRRSFLSFLLAFGARVGLADGTAKAYGASREAPSGETSSSATEDINLGLKQAQQAGSFELVEQTAVGDVALLREKRFDSQLSWRIPANVTPGWYRVRFPATARFQVTAAMQREREPFIFNGTNFQQRPPASA